MAGLGALCAAAPAAATISLVAATGQLGGENVTFSTAQSGPVLTGTSAATNRSILFNGLGGMLTTRGGAAFLGPLNTATPNPNDTLSFTTFRVSRPGGGLFNNTSLSLYGGTATSATFTVVDNSGQTFSFANQPLGNGLTRFGFLGTNNETIRSITVSTNGGGINGVRQIRLIPIAGTAVPEPRVWAMLLLGFGLVGVASRRRPGARQVSA
jgi:hypothetical protein